MRSITSAIGVAGLVLATAAHAQVVGFATNPQGSFYYSAGAAVAQVVQQKASVASRVQPMSGSSAYAPLVNRGEVEFGLMNAIDVGNAYEGILNFKGRKNSDLRLVGVLFPIALGIAVPNDSPIKSIKDIKGLRIPSQFAAQSTIVFVQDALLATAGLTMADMKPFPVSDYTKGMLALGDGKVDVAMFGVGTGAAQEAHVALSSRGGLRFLDTSDAPDAAERMHKVFAATYTKLYEPSPANVGVLAPTKLMLYPAFLVTSSHVSPDLVYKVTKSVFENKALLEGASPVLKGFEPNQMAMQNSVPYHPGAEKYFKEAKQWPPKKL